MISIEVDGERIAFDDFYEDSDFYPYVSLYGMNEKTKRGDQVRNYESTDCVWSLAAFRVKEDGSYFGIQGLFRCGEWEKDENDEPLLKVWDRII